MGKLIDEVGKKYGRLTVLSRSEEYKKKTTRAYWVCQCECGNTTVVSGAHLRRGSIQSCGCLQKEKTANSNKEKLDDLTGQQFGNLIVIKRIENKKKQTAWLCKCSCGVLTEVMGCNLKRVGGTRSCGCCSSSSGEKTITELLTSNDITFKREYKFKDCLSEKGEPYRFDFAIIENNQVKYLIEYHGRQHYMEIEGYFHDNLSSRIKKDNDKVRYCFKNKIPLIVIPYTHLGKITLNDLNIETSSFIKEEI